MSIDGKDLAAELKRFLESDEGKSLCDPVTLKASEQMRTYLENRIRHAFRAGVAWAEAYAQKEEPPANTLG